MFNDKYGLTQAVLEGRKNPNKTNSLYAKRICVTVVSIVAATIGFILVADARMERDHANKEMVKLQQQVEELSCTVEAERSIK